jgi:hypothetical protein
MLNIQELDKEKMDIMKELADTRLKISEAGNVLTQLKTDESTYLNKREKKALDGIEKILEDSKDLLIKTHENYDEIHKLCQTISSFTGFVLEAHGKFQDLLTDFNTRSESWDREVARQHGELAEIRRNINTERTIIENEQKGIKAALKKIEKEKTLIESRQSQIKVAIELLNKKQKNG